MPCSTHQSRRVRSDLPAIAAAFPIEMHSSALKGTNVAETFMAGRLRRKGLTQRKSRQCRRSAPCPSLRPEASEPAGAVELLKKGERRYFSHGKIADGLRSCGE